MGTVHTMRGPLQPPLHPAKRHPFAAVARSRSCAYDVACRRQRAARHIAPAPDTAPRPATETTRPNRSGANSAPTDAAAVSPTSQRSEPEQAPDQRMNRCPCAANASSSTVVPASHSVVQLAEQSIPGMSLSTEPVPTIPRANETWRLTRRNQPES